MEFSTPWGRSDELETAIPAQAVQKRWRVERPQGHPVDRRAVHRPGSPVPRRAGASGMPSSVSNTVKIGPVAGIRRRRGPVWQ